MVDALISIMLIVATLIAIGALTYTMSPYGLRWDRANRRDEREYQRTVQHHALVGDRIDAYKLARQYDLPWWSDELAEQDGRKVSWL